MKINLEFDLFVEALSDKMEEGRHVFRGFFEYRFLHNENKLRLSSEVKLIIFTNKKITALVTIVTYRQLN
ncbi:hypothetical protein BCR23_08645 [Enterococcus quebecensis]|uniref:Uncharacterized protein n=1 Tax=Enterococcus quebecensis TaxID=903983 RepID=A0A1E5GS49_9ENTE|nr:hypothetical protein BCR23_08645 [Enterococcus quebecensis]